MRRYSAESIYKKIIFYIEIYEKNQVFFEQKITTLYHIYDYGAGKSVKKSRNFAIKKGKFEVQKSEKRPKKGVFREPVRKKGVKKYACHKGRAR